MPQSVALDVEVLLMLLEIFCPANSGFKSFTFIKLHCYKVITTDSSLVTA